MQITNGKKCIEVNNVSFSYNGQSVLENISFSVNTGDYVGLIGPNGGGKTTLIKIILGLLKPTTGTVRIFGKDIKEFKEKSLIGYVPQHVSKAVSHLPATVKEVIETGRTARIGLFKKPTKDDERAVEKAMKMVGVLHLQHRLIENLSGGELQKVFIARALAGEPKILILDEPNVGVDLASQEQFYNFLQKLNQEFGLTILFVSHDIDIISCEVKCLLCLNKNLIYHGLPEEFLTREYIEKLYGKKVKFIFHRH